MKRVCPANYNSGVCMTSLLNRTIDLIGDFEIGKDTPRNLNLQTTTFFARV